MDIPKFCLFDLYIFLIFFYFLNYRSHIRKYSLSRTNARVRNFYRHLRLLRSSFWWFIIACGFLISRRMLILFSSRFRLIRIKRSTVLTAVRGSKPVRRAAKVLTGQPARYNVICARAHALHIKLLP